MTIKEKMFYGFKFITETTNFTIVLVPSSEVTFSKNGPSFKEPKKILISHTNHLW